MNTRILAHFKESADLKTQAAKTLAKPIETAIERLFTAITNGHKVLVCGNGGSAADSQHFAAELIGRFERERLPLPAVALTTDTSILTALSNDYGYQDIFAKQVQALGLPEDILLTFSTSGNSANILAAIEMAQKRHMHVVALTGNNGGKIIRLLTETDVHICVPHQRTCRIQEVHLLVLHCLCDGIDATLLGEENYA